MIRSALKRAIVVSAAATSVASSAAEPPVQVPRPAIEAFADHAYDRAGTLARNAAEQCTSQTPLDPRCLEVLEAAARYLVAARRFQEAAEMGRIARATAEKHFGQDSRETARALLAAGPAEGGLDNPGLGVNLISAAAEILRKADAESMDLAEALRSWAAAEDAEEFTYSDQEARHREAIRIAAAKLGEAAQGLAPFYLGLGRNLRGQGRLEDAEAAFRKGLSLSGPSATANEEIVQRLYAGLAETIAPSRPDEAVLMQRRAHAIDAARTRQDTWLHVEPMRALANLLVEAGDLDEAKALLDSAEQMAVTDSLHRADESLLAFTRGRLLEATNQLEPAEAAFRRADQKLAERKDEVIGLFRAYEIHRALGRNLLRQGKLNESLAAYQTAQSDLEFVGFIENNPVQADATGDVAVLRMLTGGDPGLARDELRLATDRAIKSSRSVSGPHSGVSAIRDSREYFKALVAANWAAANGSVVSGQR